MLHTTFLSPPYSQLYPGKFNAVRPSPRTMSRPTARKLTAVEVPLPTNNPREQPRFTREALNKIHFPDHFEVSGQRGLPSTGAPFRGAPQNNLNFQKYVAWIAHRRTVVMRKNDRSFQRKSEDRFPTEKKYKSACRYCHLGSATLARTSSEDI